jgi:hypothetical protein
MCDESMFLVLNLGRVVINYGKFYQFTECRMVNGEWYLCAQRNVLPRIPSNLCSPNGLRGAPVVKNADGECQCTGSLVCGSFLKNFEEAFLSSEWDQSAVLRYTHTRLGSFVNYMWE